MFRIRISFNLEIFQIFFRIFAAKQEHFYMPTTTSICTKLIIWTDLTKKIEKSDFLFFTKTLVGSRKRQLGRTYFFGGIGLDCQVPSCWYQFFCHDSTGSQNLRKMLKLQKKKRKNPEVLQNWRNNFISKENFHTWRALVRSLG